MMETGSGERYKDEQLLELPPGFRFYPSDEELVTHYLLPKVYDNTFRCIAIGEADLNKCEPWDLPWRAKMGEKEWYFFSLKDRKYPTGMRTNRATESGYWKATGKDKEIHKMKTLVGMKKTLVFYRGRAPKGNKTNWVMHEFRLDGKYSVQNLPKTDKNEWVISRVFEKCSGGKKIHIIREATNGQSLRPHLPPLMDASLNHSRTEGEGGSQVTGFSNSTENQSQMAKEVVAVDSSKSVTQLPNASSSLYPLPDYTYNNASQFIHSFSTQTEHGSLVMQNQDLALENMLKTRKWNSNNNNNWPRKTEPQHIRVVSQGGVSAADLDSVWKHFMQ